ncbi:hypothetical protein [Pseudokineococcus marinus]|uniref:Uncharacterized protein n=1 Tax=Pseudokineococcus marinus TaxID=351215 RepID=A0A849BK21_9ACTN|nr:hypothetical protein [Pseudokineococcus marinus]NNH21705.1 hypothetical protein [Pseudokineococcus marinus]
MLLDWLGAWAQSPGFGGLAAVVAAVIAYRAARKAADTQRANAEEDRKQRERAERKNQWWARAQWALDLTLSQDTEIRTVGYDMLDALANSEWADEHEAELIAAATDRALGPVADESEAVSTQDAPRRTLRSQWKGWWRWLTTAGR